MNNYRAVWYDMGRQYRGRWTMLAIARLELSAKRLSGLMAHIEDKDGNIIE